MEQRVLDPKTLSSIQSQFALRAFLQTQGRIKFPAPKKVRVSIVILVHNRAELTFRCLQSLAYGTYTNGIEIIIVDNGSSDCTQELLQRIDGIKVIANPRNVGFPVGVNQGAGLATGEYLLLLNNDTEVLGRSIDDAAEYLDRHHSVGAVGGKIILLDGSLQEAGCGIWRNGWTHQHGRGADPDHFAFSFRREVDYCSAAFLMIRRSAFEKIGGLDPIFSPGYFEDPDFCIRLWQLGWLVMYLPEISILHHENATAGKLFSPHEMVLRNYKTFCQRNAAWLSYQPDANTDAGFGGELARTGSSKVLVIDSHAGSNKNFPETQNATQAMLRNLYALDCFCTVVRIGGPESEALNTTSGENSTPVEFVRFSNLQETLRNLAPRKNWYDVVIVDSLEYFESMRQFCSERGKVAIYTPRFGLLNPHQGEQGVRISPPKTVHLLRSLPQKIDIISPVLN